MRPREFAYAILEQTSELAQFLNSACGELDLEV